MISGDAIQARVELFMSECRYCGVGLGDKRSWVCAPCSIVRDRIRARTHIAVGNAIRKLAEPTGSTRLSASGRNERVWGVMK